MYLLRLTCKNTEISSTSVNVKKIVFEVLTAISCPLKALNRFFLLLKREAISVFINETAIALKNFKISKKNKFSLKITENQSRSHKKYE